MKLLQVLIPTYNRREALLKNLEQLHRLLGTSSLFDKVGLVVSDNCSTDGAFDAAREFVALADPRLDVQLARQETNVGLERNAVSVLQHASAPNVMFLGDDDYLPEGYLPEVVDRLERDGPQCIIPGFSEVMADGRIELRRGGKPKDTLPGFGAVRRLSLYGHQLSGLVVPRKGLLERYLARPQFRNVYLFMFFVAASLEQVPGHYLPQFQVLVSCGNVKDWRYDSSGLLAEMFKNYESLYEGRRFEKIYCCLRVAYRQRWRLGLKDPIDHGHSALRHLLGMPGISTGVKVAFVAFYPYLYLRAIMKRV